MTPDLNELTLKELRDLQKEVDRAIATFEDRKKGEARLEVEQLARKLGYNLGELLTAPAAKRSNGSVAPKYRNPENPEMTWTGRGRKPKWVEAALAAGKPLSALEI